MKKGKELATMGLQKILSSAESGGGMTGIDTGYETLNYATTGLQPGWLVILAGRPAMGKSAMAMNMARAAVMGKIKTMVFSLEMTAVELIVRWLCTESEVDVDRVRRGIVSTEEWPKLMEAGKQIGNYDLLVEDVGAATLAHINKCVGEHKPELVIVDYLQICGVGKRSESREREVSELSRGFKSLAKDHSCTALVLSQLSRRVEERTDKRPTLGDLRESGAIEQDADLVLFLHRPGYYDTQISESDAELIIGKNRHGPSPQIDLVWKPEYQLFKEVKK